MAIYHLSAQVISRSKGQSAVASAAYRSGEKLHDSRTGETKYYVREVAPDNEIIAPENAPNWVYDREKLWNEVEKSEVRKDSQLAREINVALPKELTNEQQKELIRSYVKEQFVEKGMVADIAIHRDDKDNPHAHIMLTTRNITQEGFKNKNREWNDKQQLENWRSEWARYANQSLEKAGSHERIDHRSHEERKLVTMPTKHLGHVAHSMEKQGKSTDIGDYNRAIKAYNQTIISLAEFREQKKEIQVQKEQRKNFSPSDLATLKQAAKIVKGYVTMEKVQTHMDKLKSQENRIEKNMSYLNWKNRNIQQVSGMYQNINSQKNTIADRQQRINSINWMNPFKLKDNRELKERFEKDIAVAESLIKEIESKIEPYKEKLKFNTESEFYKVQTNFNYDKMYQDNLSSRKEINNERDQILMAQVLLERSFSHQLADSYGDQHPELKHLNYTAAQTLTELNKDGLKTPDDIHKMVSGKEHEIKDLESQVKRVSELQSNVMNAEHNLEKYEAMSEKVKQIESNPIAKAKMLLSKSAKAEYQNAIATRDSSLHLAAQLGVPTREELSVQKEKLERMVEHVPAVKEKIESLKEELKPLEHLERCIYSATKQYVGEQLSQQNKGKKNNEHFERDFERDMGR